MYFRSNTPSHPGTMVATPMQPSAVSTQGSAAKAPAQPGLQLPVCQGVSVPHELECGKVRSLRLLQENQMSFPMS